MTKIFGKLIGTLFAASIIVTAFPVASQAKIDRSFHPALSSISEDLNFGDRNRLQKKDQLPENIRLENSDIQVAQKDNDKTGQDAEAN